MRSGYPSLLSNCSGTTLMQQSDFEWSKICVLVNVGNHSYWSLQTLCLYISHSYKQNSMAVKVNKKLIAFCCVKNHCLKLTTTCMTVVHLLQHLSSTHTPWYKLNVASLPGLPCFLFCIQYNTRMRNNGDKRRRPGLTLS